MDYKTFHKLSYGLYIIASGYEGKKAGYVGNTAFQVTSKPPQLAISCHKENATLDVILKSGVFSVSVLKKELNIKIIGDFGFMSSSDIDKFASVKTTTAISGAPIVLDESLAWFDCKVVQTIDVGSHIMIVGEILDSQVIDEGEPLTYEYYREKYKMLAPKNAPTYIEQVKPEEPAVHEKKPEEPELKTYICTICGFTYKEEEGDSTIGILPATRFEDLPDDYKCPICNASKEYFRET